MILIFIVGGANAEISFCIQSTIPEKIMLSWSFMTKKTSSLCHLVFSCFLSNHVQEYYFPLFTKEIANSFFRTFVLLFNFCCWVNLLIWQMVILKEAHVIQVKSICSTWIAWHNVGINYWEKCYIFCPKSLHYDCLWGTGRARILTNQWLWLNLIELLNELIEWAGNGLRW